MFNFRRQTNLDNQDPAIVRRGRNWSVSHLIPIPVGDSNSTCFSSIPNKKLISSEQLNKVVLIDDDKVYVGKQPMFYSAGCALFRYFTLEDLKNQFPAECENTSDTLVTHIKDDSYAITHPPKKLQVTCSNTSE
uniref:Uncharacterized protein n=1 Tax=Cacopsylla melanoneura TaxID=428564 RepID=A0A8D8Z4P0_9HEMI